MPRETSSTTSKHDACSGGRVNGTQGSLEEAPGFFEGASCAHANEAAAAESRASSSSERVRLVVVGGVGVGVGVGVEGVRDRVVALRDRVAARRGAGDGAR